MKLKSLTRIGLCAAAILCVVPSVMAQNKNGQSRQDRKTAKLGKLQFGIIQSLIYAVNKAEKTVTIHFNDVEHVVTLHPSVILKLTGTTTNWDYFAEHCLNKAFYLNINPGPTDMTDQIMDSASFAEYKKAGSSYSGQILKVDHNYVRVGIYVYAINDATRIIKGGREVKQKSLQPGDRVVIRGQANSDGGVYSMLATSITEDTSNPQIREGVRKTVNEGTKKVSTKGQEKLKNGTGSGTSSGGSSSSAKTKGGTNSKTKSTGGSTGKGGGK